MSGRAASAPPRERAAILQVESLSAGYGNKSVVRDLDFSLTEGELLLVLGHNGAGKTTTMQAIFGLISPSAGEVRYRGRRITDRKPADNVLDGIAYVPQGHGIFRRLTVRRNLELGAFVVKEHRIAEERMETVFELFPILRERASQLGGTLSGGQQQMLAIGMALIHAPAVIILDEPSIGLAPNLVARMMASIQSINERFGTSILMVEQNVKYSLPIADRVVVLKTGRKVYDGPPAALADRVELMKLF
jgi:branched-chain amino acid transport system ATP-binding protein